MLKYNANLKNPNVKKNQTNKACQLFIIHKNWVFLVGMTQDKQKALFS